LQYQCTPNNKYLSSLNINCYGKSTVKLGARQTSSNKFLFIIWYFSICGGWLFRYAVLFGFGLVGVARLYWLPLAVSYAFSEVVANYSA
jgi:hypothetical protein